MDPEQTQLFDELRLKRDAEREEASRQAARTRVLAREDVESVEIREDGTMWCTGYDGSVTLRPGGWRGRS